MTFLGMAAGLPAACGDDGQNYVGPSAGAGAAGTGCAIDNDCPATAPFCVNGTCLDMPAPCDAGLVDCPGVGCVDVSADPNHCGSCESDCGGGTCVSGNCTCAGPGMINCPGAGCVDVSTDPDHCGGCDNSCNGLQCVSGNCVCDAPLLDCGGCTDPSADPNNCGGCNAPCGQPEYCDAGSCECKPGLTSVNGQCLDLQSNPNNCGGMGPCGTNAPMCLNGMCVNDCGNLNECNNACVDTNSNPLHCGDCNNPCNQSEVCVDGNCQEWQVAVGCSTCPCPSSCNGDFNNCCSYPGDSSLVICVEGDQCP